MVLILIASMVVIASAANNSSKRKGSTREHEEPKYEPGVIVVKLRPTAEIIKNRGGLARTGIESVDGKLEYFEVSKIEKRFKHKPIPLNSNLPDLSRVYTIHFSKKSDPLYVAEVFARDHHIEYAEPMYIYTYEEIPNDTLYPQQYYLPQISAPQAWDLQHGDSTVVIAIVDNGIDWEHPDLYDNIWTNEAEAGGIEGVDDDENGWVDDVHGYDLGEDDPNPTHCPPDYQDYYDHGTCTAGLAAAITNNVIGITSISWNCEVMPVKISHDRSPEYARFGLDGIVYATENGADIISLSWGRSGDYSQEEQDVIDYAHGLGCVVVASGGNRTTYDFHYPSSYAKVISVCWVDQNDVKNRDATWGMSIDVCAPGVDIMSTIPREGNSQDPYGYNSGSSMACPIVAGLCGLVKSHHPDWTNNQIIRQVVLTADNIDHLNPQYDGALGSGRINAHRALTETELKETPPRIGIAKFTPNDTAGGDGDGIFEPGERIHVTTILQNFSLRDVSTPVIVTVSTPNSDLTIEDGSAGIGFFPSDTTITMVDHCSFSIAPDATSHVAELHLYTAYENYGGFDVFRVYVGQSGETALVVLNGKGFPGSKNNVVSIDLYNDKPLDTVWLDLLFDTNTLSVNEVRLVGRASGLCHFWWSSISRGVYIAMHGCQGQYIYSGTGSIVDILFDVADSASPREYELILSDFFAGVQPYDYNTLPINGAFIVAPQGDVNGDNRVNILDAILTVNIALGTHQPTPNELSAADCNSDNEINILDVICIVNRILEG